jgi:hypothetical protein
MFLRIENKVSHIPDIDILCTLGESTSRGNNETIGQFGSGFIYSLALFARHGILRDCKICLGTDVYTPFIITNTRKDSAGQKRDIAKIGLKKQNGGTYDLNVSTGFGEMDWHNIGMGVREFISNAIDGAITYNSTIDSVKLETVNDNQCRAADGVIRVYIPITDDIQDYVSNIDNYFICLKKAYNNDIRVLAKVSRGPCKVYRKGVLVGEFGEDSLFDYNIPDIYINESRTIKANEAKENIGKALVMHARPSQLDRLMNEIIIGENETCWESTISILDLDPVYMDDNAVKNFEASLARVLGDNILCKDSLQEIMLEKKGRTGIIPRNSDNYRLLARHTTKIATNILDDSEALGRTVIPPTQRVLNVLDEIWNKIVAFNLTNGRGKPAIHCFNASVDAGSQTFGYVDSKYTSIYIHQDISEDMGNQLYTVMIEEVTHYVKMCGDYTRDFQSFVVNLCARLIRGE